MFSVDIVLIIIYNYPDNNWKQILLTDFVVIISLMVFLYEVKSIKYLCSMPNRPIYYNFGAFFPPNKVVTHIT